MSPQRIFWIQGDTRTACLCFHCFSLPSPETSIPLSTSFLPTFFASIPVVLSVCLSLCFTLAHIQETTLFP